MPGPQTHPLSSKEFAAIAAIVKNDSRIHVAERKKSLVHSRLSRRIREKGLKGFADYVALVESDAVERAAMVCALTTNHTHFFREDHHFDHVRKTLLPEFRNKPENEPLRIWSAGCSSGEEVYSIAMCILEAGQADPSWLRRADIRLLATDISDPVVEKARQGLYSDDIVAPIPREFRKWLRREGSSWRMADEARELVTARPLNLFGEWPMRQRYDAIFCRNVMIYFEEEPQEELELRFAELLKPGGYLYIGHSERIVGRAAKHFKRCGMTIFRKATNGGQQ